MKTNLDDYITLKNVNHALLKMNAQNPISKYSHYGKVYHY